MSLHHQSDSAELNTIPVGQEASSSAGATQASLDRSGPFTASEQKSANNNKPIPPEIANSAKTLEERILSMLQKVVSVEVEEIRRSYDHKINQMEEEIHGMRLALAQAQAQLKDVSARVPFRPAEVNRIALEDFIKSEPLATRLIYSASATAANDDSMPPTKKRKQNDETAVASAPTEAASSDSRRSSTPTRSARPTAAQSQPETPVTPASSSRPQRRVRTSYKDFGNISASEDDDDEEFKAKAQELSDEEATRPRRAAAAASSSTAAVNSASGEEREEKPYLLLFRRPPGDTKRFFFTTEQLSIMNEWLIQHLDNPYPTDADRDFLCSAIDLPWTKINTWITNARRRVVGKLLEQREKGELPVIFSSGGVKVAGRQNSGAGQSGEEYYEEESDDARSAPAAGDEMQVDAQSGQDMASGRDMDLDL